MTNPTKFAPYRSQLLRMWVEQSMRCTPVWRFSLEDVATGKRSGFADLDALITHLLALMEPGSPPHPPAPSPERTQERGLGGEA